MDDPHLRVGGPDDLAIAQRIHDDFYVTTGMYAPVFSQYVAESIQAFKEGWDPDRDRAWVAEAGARVVGYIAVCHRDDDLAQLRYLYVDPAARGNGLGRRLVQKVVDFCQDTGYPGIMLWTMEGLDAARRLYETFGWRLTETAEAPWHETLVQQRFDVRF